MSKSINVLRKAAPTYEINIKNLEFKTFSFGKLIIIWNLSIDLLIEFIHRLTKIN